MSEHGAGAGEGPDVGADGKLKDDTDQRREATKTQDATKAGRKDFDPNTGQE